MKKGILLFIPILLLVVAHAFSQTAPVIDTSQNVILLKERHFGLILHSQGWGARFGKGYNKTAFNRRTWVVEFIEIQSPRQIRTINPYFTNSKSYVYGKLNTVFALRGAMGNFKQLNRKPYWGGVEVRFFYMGGASLAITKPVYLYILNPLPDDYDYTITEEKYDPDEHFLDNIFGRAPFTRGFDNLDFYPGFHLRTGFEFDYASYRTSINSLEAGVVIDVFPRAVPIMAYNEPNNYFLTLYLSINFGKRYNAL